MKNHSLFEKVAYGVKKSGGVGWGNFGGGRG